MCKSVYAVLFYEGPICILGGLGMIDIGLTKLKKDPYFCKAVQNEAWKYKFVCIHFSLAPVPDLM